MPHHIFSMYRVSFTPFSVLNCFSLYVSLYFFYMFSFLTVVSADKLSRHLFLCYDSVSFMCTPICLCLSGNLLQFSIYFSFVSLFTVYHCSRSLIFHTVLAIITFFSHFIRWWVQSYTYRYSCYKKFFLYSTSLNVLIVMCLYIATTVPLWSFSSMGYRWWLENNLCKIR